MPPKPIHYLQGEVPTPNGVQQNEHRVFDGVSTGQGRDSKRPVLERVKPVNPQSDNKPKSNGGRMMANGRPPMDGGSRMQPGHADGFSDRQGNTLKRRSSQQDPRPHHQGPPIDDRKRQRNAPWPHPPPSGNGAAGVPRQAGPMMVLQDPEVQLIDTSPHPQGAVLSHVRGPPVLVHPVPARRPQQDQMLRSGVTVSRVAAPQGSRYDTEKLTAMQAAISQAEEAFHEAQTQAQDLMSELPLRLKSFLEEQVACLASACGFSVSFSDPANGAATGAVVATFSPSWPAALAHVEAAERAAMAQPPSPRQNKKQNQAAPGGGAPVNAGAARPAQPAWPVQPAHVTPPAGAASVPPAGVSPAIMSRVSVAPHPHGNHGAPQERTSLHDRLEHDTAAPVCYQFTKEGSRETPERGGETPSEDDEGFEEDRGSYGDDRRQAHRGSGPPRWAPNSGHEDGFAPGRGGDRPGPGGGRVGGMGRGGGGGGPSGDGYAGKYGGGRGSPPPMGGRAPGRGRGRSYATGPGMIMSESAWEEAPLRTSRGGRRQQGGRRGDGPEGRGRRGGRGPPMDGGDGYRDGGRGRGGRGRGQFGDFR